MKSRPAIALVLLALLSAAGSLRSTARDEPDRVVTAVIAGQRFDLELAADAASRDRGLAGRSEVSARGGMLFVFPDAEWQLFVMRDCATPIDLLFLDESGVVTAAYSMLPEPPRTTGERAGTVEGDRAYDARLKGYASPGPSPFAVEVKGGTIESIGVRVGDRVGLDLRALRALAN